MEIINGRPYYDKHPERDTLSSGKRGVARRVERQRMMEESGLVPDYVAANKVNPRKACPERGDSL